MAAAFIQSRSAWERMAIAAMVMAPTFYALWSKRVDMPRGREALEEARHLSQELAQYGAVVIPVHGLATDPDQKELARTKARMNTRLHWSELRLALQRFWRAAADETIDIDDPTTWPDPDKLDADWEARHAYTLRAPVAPLGMRSRISAAKWTRGDGAPQLVLAAFLDPTMSKIHFGDDTHRYLRLAAWFPYRPASLPQDEPSAAELQALIEALPADSPARALFGGEPPVRSTKEAAEEDADVASLLAELRVAASEARA